MGESTAIEWADHTFNPWIGCQRVSPACQHCYAETLNRRWGGGNWGANADRRITSEANWRLPVRWDRAAERDGVRRRVFCASMADVFEDRPDLEEPRARLWDLIAATPHLDWLLLTKRPENVRGMVPRRWAFGVRTINEEGSTVEPCEWPVNVWVGTTVEDQKRADERVPHLLDVPAPVRFLSCEPLLGPVDLSAWLDRLGWVIAGGESGHGSRPSHPDWFRSLRDQCQQAGVPFFFKQWGEWGPAIDHLDTAPGTTLARAVSWNGPEGEAVAPVGKKAAGRLLDGRTWDEVPRGLPVTLIDHDEEADR